MAVGKRQWSVESFKLVIRSFKLEVDNWQLQVDSWNVQTAVWSLIYFLCWTLHPTHPKTLVTRILLQSSKSKMSHYQFDIRFLFPFFCPSLARILSSALPSTTFCYGDKVPSPSRSGRALGAQLGYRPELKVLAYCCCRRRRWQLNNVLPTRYR